uniref:Predicted protein n=3 Tax=Mesangiospermae TaxID=1437183 RepID=F2E7S2_HORVV|nr:predicted protein [Hordeum vulgare subsp. vulgare]
MIKMKNNEYDELRNQYARLEPELRRKAEMEISLQEQQNHIVGMAADIEGYERRLKAQEQELEREKNFTNEFAFKIIVLSCEIERLSQ